MKHQFIHKETLFQYFEEHRGTIALLNLLIRILEQIRDLLEAGAPRPSAPEGQGHLPPLTDERVRRAIVRLREEGLLTRKTHWLGVLKVLVAKGVIRKGHTQYKRMEDYLKRLLAGDPRFDLAWVANTLSKKCGQGGELFAGDLPDWLRSKRPRQYGLHLRIAKRFLVLLEEG